ncbi:1-acyl-sn-glycerol-3-phosphate acyltransferase [Parafilimonas terrae]|jgi:1-acyl-sn-glycerol-3-phosphate acyltransferase|uniref:Acyltransferase n=1 Tax=Parafilimonas terrae TaxID=1465490 RepID=A0A1I5R677_9BACT|nr:1-acyl-sn-glycerol-3-phosphate acyltransferase [Parafilimonas terrae]SFP54028.1 Acyltransferase [Parafilimonas terrae]
MLYNVLKIWVRLAAHIFCRKIIINNRKILKEKGPLLIACNHPNSFLDSVILDILFEQPLWSLARGDAFISKKVSRFFKSVRMLPVYRASEGVENLSGNYKTFEACLNIFRRNGLVHIYSEGKCINEWHLRPLKKGTARLAIKAWEENIPLKVLPAGINYSSFRRFGKNVFINFGEIFTADIIDWNSTDGTRHFLFNNILRNQLEQLVFEIDKNDKAKQVVMLQQQPSQLKKIILAIPAIAGLLIHLPLYMPAKNYVLKRFANSDHYDSVLIGILIFTYPVYLLMITLITFAFTQSAWVFLLLLILPFTAWSYVQLKKQMDKQ